MISHEGVKANMCCASCLYSTAKAVGLGVRGIKEWCKKKNILITSPGNKCGFYTMSKFFQERGYKPVKGGALP